MDIGHLGDKSRKTHRRERTTRFTLAHDMDFFVQKQRRQAVVGGGSRSSRRGAGRQWEAFSLLGSVLVASIAAEGCAFFARSL